MTHCMGDTETLGNKPGCVILSIGAVIFDPALTDEPLKTFYRNIDIMSCLMIGLTIDQGTVDWWKKQSPEARAALTVDQQPIQKVLVDFYNFCKENEVDRFWCQGATFDAPILDEAFKLSGMQTPWKFTQVRDTRTIFDEHQLDYYKEPRVGDHHNALDDAIFQVNCMHKCAKKWDAIEKYTRADAAK